MKKKYFAPEMEEMEFETPTLLEGSGCADETEISSDSSCDGITAGGGW